MHRVITNLVVNALKYSPPDSVVDIGFSRARAGFLQMTVSDRGRGIDPGDLGVIFDEFVRGRMAEDDGGTGLGLASVRELVHQQNGHVSIESEVGVGTTVTVELPSHAFLKPAAPAQRSASSAESAVSAAPPSRSRRGRRVLAGDGTYRPLPGIVLGRVLHLLAQLLARPVVEPVAEHGAVGVVGLVLEAAGEQPAPLVGDVLPVQPLPDDPGVVGPGAVDEGARVGQAALLAVVELAVLALRQGQHRVAHDAAMDGAGVVGAVEDEDRQVDPDLAGGETDAVGGVHRRDHVGDQRAQLVVVRRDRVGPCGASPRCPTASRDGPFRRSGARPRWGRREAKSRPESGLAMSGTGMREPRHVVKVWRDV